MAPGRTGETWAGIYKGACSIDINMTGDCGDGNSDDGEGKGSKPPTTPKQPPKGNPQVGGNNDGGGRPNPNNGGDNNYPWNPLNILYPDPRYWSGGNGNGYDDFKKEADKIANKRKEDQRYNNDQMTIQIAENRRRRETCESNYDAFVECILGEDRVFGIVDKTSSQVGTTVVTTSMKIAAKSAGKNAHYFITGAEAINLIGAADIIINVGGCGVAVYGGTNSNSVVDDIVKGCK